MLTYKQFDDLEEHVVNFLPGDEAEKAKHAPAVFSMLQKSYAPIGGIHGSGFKDHEDMINKIHMWKIHKQDGAIKAVALYKNNSEHGRKRVAVATDGSIEGKASLSKMMSADMTQKRSYGELSGSALKMAKRSVPDIEKHVIPTSHVKKISQGDEILPVPHDDPEAKAHPELTKHLYQRKIGSEIHTKLMVGTPGKMITPRK